MIVEGWPGGGWMRGPRKCQWLRCLASFQESIGRKRSQSVQGKRCRQFYVILHSFGDLEVKPDRAFLHTDASSQGHTL